MSSDPRRDNDQPMFASKTPHFFKIILQEAIADGRLGIPRKFVRKYGNQLSSPVKLEVPSGAIWQVELTKSDERVWLQKGWREFAEHYSLEFGSFLVFRYQGNDHFHVLIFDRSASEIEYAFGKNKEKPDLPCTVAQKKRRTDSSLHISLDCPKSSKIDLENLKKNENSCSSTGKVDGVGRISVRGSPKMEVLSCSQRLTNTEKARAIQIANDFRSTENPVFMVVLRPSSVSCGYQLSIPLDFAREFLTKHKCNLTLCNSAGKTWPVTYYVNAGSKTRQAQLYGGWQAFVQDNHLGVGDICVFEVIKLHEMLLRVHIYPVVEYASKTCRSQAHKTKAGPVRTSTVSASDTKPDCQRIRCSSIAREFEGPNLDKQKNNMDLQYSTKELGGEFIYSAKHDNGGGSSVRGCLKPDCMGKSKMQPSTPTEKQRAADIASWSSSGLVRRKSTDKSHLSSPLPRKKIRTNSPSYQCGTNSKLEVLSSGINPDDDERCVKTEVFSCMRRLTAIEKARAARIASAFKGSGSGNPVFMVVMQPSYVSNTYKMFVPPEFARNFLTMHKCSLTLCNSAGKTWPAKYFCNPKYKNLKAHLYRGWRSFVDDNHLRVGDICIFELIKHSESEILMKVVIYPAVENTSKACKQPAHGSIAGRVKTRSLASDTEPNRQQSQFEDLTDSDIEIIAGRVKTRSLASDTEPNRQQSQFEDLTDSDIEILDVCPVNQKTKKKSASTSIQPCKMVRNNPMRKTRRA
ncbi:hypothetical protein HRI_004546700 [Hibiscus trionum]|uniref:TF-B3 domain-containing protein n=1 Tax=Hibiscus trionum TaxID=183268 RepID=A0A9W7J7I3_HIBTR|nr:hypothetical protein HRI_004546700 [Hibiscus trionum]